MKVVSLLEFRKNSKKIFERALKGECMIMTYRRKPVLRLEPLLDQSLHEDDAFYHIDLLAQDKGGSLENKQMDTIVYGL